VEDAILRRGSAEHQPQVRIFPPPLHDDRDSLIGFTGGTASSDVSTPVSSMTHPSSPTFNTVEPSNHRRSATSEDSALTNSADRSSQSSSSSFVEESARESSLEDWDDEEKKSDQKLLSKACEGLTRYLSYMDTNRPKDLSQIQATIAERTDQNHFEVLRYFEDEIMFYHYTPKPEKFDMLTEKSRSTFSPVGGNDDTSGTYKTRKKGRW